MKTSFFAFVFVLFCAVSLATDSQQLQFKTGTGAIIAKPRTNRETGLKIEGIGLSVGFGETGFSFKGELEYRVVPGKRPEEIQDPTQYVYRRARKDPVYGTAAVVYDKTLFEQGYTLMVKVGEKYLALKPIKWLPVYRLPSSPWYEGLIPVKGWTGSEAELQQFQQQLQEKWERLIEAGRANGDKFASEWPKEVPIWPMPRWVTSSAADTAPQDESPGIGDTVYDSRVPRVGGMVYEYKYWPNAVQTVREREFDERSYSTGIETCTAKPGVSFSIPGTEDCLSFTWRLQEPVANQKGFWCLDWAMKPYILKDYALESVRDAVIAHREDPPAEKKAKLENLKDVVNSFRSQPKINSQSTDLSVGGYGISPFCPGVDISLIQVCDRCSIRYVAVELVSGDKDKVVYKRKFWRMPNLEAKQTAESERLKAQKEEAKKEAGVKTTKLSDIRKFNLPEAGVRLWWDVAGDNSLSLNYEAATNSTGTLEFAASRKSEMEDVDGDDVASLSFKELTGKPINFPLNRIGVFRTNKGCAAIKPTSVENGGRAIVAGEEKITKTVTFESRAIPVQSTKVAQGMATSNR